MTAMQASQVRAVGSEITAKARGLIRSMPDADPLDMAKLVLAEVGEDDAKALLSLCLLVWVERELAVVRSRDRKPLPLPPHTVPAVNPPPTSGAARVREWYANRLTQMVVCGQGAKQFQECTSDDLRSAAEIRIMQAEQLTKIANLMDRSGLSTVRQIAADELWSLMGGPR